MIASTCPGCGSPLSFSLWNLTPVANYPVSTLCRSCMSEIRLPHWWNALTILVGMSVSVAVPLALDVDSTLLAVLLFAVTFFPLMISINALYVVSGRHLCVER